MSFYLISSHSKLMFPIIYTYFRNTPNLHDTTTSDVGKTLIKIFVQDDNKFPYARNSFSSYL